jgi:hypothetical protein
MNNKIAADEIGEKFNQAQRAADAAFAASDKGREAGERWTAAVRSAQDIARAEREAAARSQARRTPARGRSR